MEDKAIKKQDKAYIIGKVISIDREALNAKLIDVTDGSEFTAIFKTHNIQNCKCILIPKIDSIVMCSTKNEIITLGSGMSEEIAYYTETLGYLTENEMKEEIKVSKKIITHLKFIKAIK